MSSGKVDIFPACCVRLSHLGVQPGTSVNETKAFWLPRKPPRITTTSIITVIWLNPIIALPESRQRDLRSAPNSVLINDISEFHTTTFLAHKEQKKRGLLPQHKQTRRHTHTYTYTHG